MKENRAHNIDWDLVAKDMAGELTPEEHEQLAHELSGEKDLLGQLSGLWGDTKYAQEVKSIDTNKAWDKVQYTIQEKANPKVLNFSFRWKKSMLVAATLIMAFVSYVIIKNTLPENQYQKVYAEAEVINIQLNDGSLVDLNIGSSLQFPEFFDSETRTVKLSGEAFFNVARNESKPFVIETNNLNIKVLGTSFNVKVIGESGDEVVTVSSGKVEVWHNNKYLILEKGEAANFIAGTNSLSKLNVLDANYKAWKTKEIEFDNVPLEEVLAIIESVYHVEINVDSEIKMDSLILTADFSHDDLDHVLSSVCRTFNLSYTLQNKKYQIISVQ